MVNVSQLDEGPSWQAPELMYELQDDECILRY